jgi:hypothetical protein
MKQLATLLIATAMLAVAVAAGTAAAGGSPTSAQKSAPSNRATLALAQKLANAQRRNKKLAAANKALVSNNRILEWQLNLALDDTFALCATNSVLQDEYRFLQAQLQEAQEKIWTLTHPDEPYFAPDWDGMMEPPSSDGSCPIIPELWTPDQSLTPAVSAASADPAPAGAETAASPSASPRTAPPDPPVAGARPPVPDPPTQTAPRSKPHPAG